MQKEEGEPTEKTYYEKAEDKEDSKAEGSEKEKTLNNTIVMAFIGDLEE